jgi:hypothetical protein
VDPPAAAELALGVVLPHLRALADENKRLRGLLGDRWPLMPGAGKNGCEGEERRG